MSNIPGMRGKEVQKGEKGDMGMKGSKVRINFKIYPRMANNP